MFSTDSHLKDFGFTKDQNGDRNSKKKTFVISNYRLKLLKLKICLYFLCFNNVKNAYRVINFKYLQFTLFKLLDKINCKINIMKMLLKKR